ncbi:MAG TPA: HD domain-containing phosphohydrolase [Thermoanaerobaculia bacterium]|nr:HD domain-containing phosphohydrolase [Thermoanaerobaculia bacterium]
MTIVAGAAAAAVGAVPPRSASTRAHGALRRAGVRLLAAALWMTVIKLLGTWLYGLPVVALLGTTSVGFVTAAVLFGWEGVVAAIVVQLAFLALLQGLGGVYPWASTASYALAGVLAWLAFRYPRHVGRGFPNLRSLGWYVVAAGIGGLVSPIVISITGHEGNVLDAIAIWSRSTVVTLWVFAPALLVLGDRRLRRLLAPIPDEVAVQPPKRVALVRQGLGGEALQVVGVDTREEHFGRVAAIGLLIVVAITAVRLALPGDWTHGANWLNLFYLFPIWWMAQRLRLPGALVASAFVGMALLAGYASLGARELNSPPLALSIYAQLLSFWLVGALLARGAEREGRLLEGVAELHGRVEQDLQRVVWALTGAVEAKDPYTSGHLQRVNAFALELGRRLGLSARDLELLQIASTLHDIGKIGIPESILNKPGALADDERTVMQRHPEIGARLLMRIEGLREAAPMVLHHQERWDGRRDVQFPGYPHGLSGEAIPLGARIIAVVDSFDAMTTDRPYRTALTPQRARAELQSERGAQFDPVVVDAFLRLIDELPWE